jgi:hypothetical protein
MLKKSAIKLFEQKQVRIHWDEKQELAIILSNM